MCGRHDAAVDHVATNFIVNEIPPTADLLWRGFFVFRNDIADSIRVTENSGSGKYDLIRISR